MEWRIRAGLPANVGTPHLADAETHSPSLDGDPYAGQVWAVEAELTPKPAARIAQITTGLLSGSYAQVVYLTSPAARPVVTRAAAALPEPQRTRVAVRGLPVAAYLPGVPQQ